MPAGARNPSSAGEPGHRGNCGRLRRPRPALRRGFSTGTADSTGAAGLPEPRTSPLPAPKGISAASLERRARGGDGWGSHGGDGGPTRWEPVGAGRRGGLKSRGSHGAPARQPGLGRRGTPHRGRPPRSADPALAHLVPRCCCAQRSRSGGSSQASASMASAGWALGRRRRRGPAGRGSSRSCLAGGRGGGGTSGREREGARRGREGGLSAEPGAAPPRAARHGPLPPAPPPAPAAPPAAPLPPPPDPRAPGRGSGTPRPSAAALAGRKGSLRASIREATQAHDPRGRGLSLPARRLRTDGRGRTWSLPGVESAMGRLWGSRVPGSWFGGRRVPAPQKPSPSTGRDAPAAPAAPSKTLALAPRPPSAGCAVRGAGEAAPGAPLPAGLWSEPRSGRGTQ